MVLLSDKGALNHYSRHAGKYISVSLLVLDASAAFLSAYLLRQNNLKMISLRQAVYDADKSGSDVDKSLTELREYVYSHMNTSLGGDKAVGLPIQLQHSYDRAVQAEKDRVLKVNASVQQDAQKFCEKQNPTGFSGRYRISCVEQYTSEHGVKETPVLQEYYQYNFASPTWTPDFAGVSIIFSVILVGLTVLKLLSDAWIKKRLNEHF